MIDVQHVTKTFHRGMQETHALENVSFNVEPGQTLAIQGPSGSGKTTLLTLIGILDRPTEGSIRFEGVDPWLLSDWQRARLRAKRIGFVFQSCNLIPDLSAWKNVALALRYAGVRRGERRRRALTALEVVGLQNRVHHRPSQLSGGEEQRVAVARAIVTSPRLLLADEPTGNLDTATGKHVMDQILALGGQGATVLVVTHNGAIAATCSRVLYLLDGRLMQVPDQGQ